MNATPRLSAPAAASDPARSGASAGLSNAEPAAKSQDFAAALSNVGAKPARKAAERKTTGSGPDGSPLPPAGNSSPSFTLSPAEAAAAGAGAAAATAAAAGAAAGGAAASPGTARGTGGADAASASGASAVAAAAPSAAGPLASQAATGALQGAADAMAGLTSGFGSLLPGGSSSAADALALSLPDAHSAVLQGAGAKGGTGVDQAIQGIGAGQSAAEVKVSSAAGSTSVKEISRAEATAAFNAATSGSSAAGGASAAQSAGSPANMNAGSQTAAATALSAAAAGIVVVDPSFANAADSPSAPLGASAAPAAGNAASGAPNLNGAPVPTSAAHAAAAAAPSLATNAQAIAALGDAGASDKHAHGQDGDSSLPRVTGDAIAGAAQSGLNAPGATAAGAVPTLRVAAGVDSQEFGLGLADRVSYMIGNNLNGAKLQVNPPQLGPIEVRIAVQGDHAQVWLTSHSGVTRDALEASTPRLREMLGAQGFGQVSVDISQRSFQDRSPQPQHYDWTPAMTRSASPVSRSAAVSSISLISNDAVDAYA